MNWLFHESATNALDNALFSSPCEFIIVFWSYPRWQNYINYNNEFQNYDHNRHVYNDSWIPLQGSQPLCSIFFLSILNAQFSELNISKLGRNENIKVFYMLKCKSCMRRHIYWWVEWQFFTSVIFHSIILFQVWFIMQSCLWCYL